MDSAFDAIDREIMALLPDKPDLHRITEVRADGTKYIFRYDTESADALLQKLGKMAADKDLSFTWYDSAVVSKRLRELQGKCRQLHERTSRVRSGGLH
jgi:hypothetical protein